MVCETDIRALPVLAIKARAKLVFPAPEGAEIIKSLPVTGTSWVVDCVVSSFAGVFYSKPSVRIK